MTLMFRRCYNRYLLAAALYTFTLAVNAQPMAAPGDKTHAVQLKLAAVPDKPGLWQKHEFSIKEDKEQRFYVRGLNPAAPLSIQLISADPTLAATISLHRLSWMKAEHQASLQGGDFNYSGRAYGDVGIRIRPHADTSSKATLLIWQGEPVAKPLVSFYNRPSADTTQQQRPHADSSVQWWQLAVVALLASIAFLLFRHLKKPAANAVLAAALVSAMLVVASPPLSAQDKDKEKPKPAATAQPAPDPYEIPADAKPAATEPMDKNKAASATPDDKDKARVTDNAGSAPKDDVAAVPKDNTDADSKPDTAVDASSEPAAEYSDRLAQAEQRIADLAQQVDNNRAELERLQYLLEQDRQNEPDADNFPALALSCKPPQIDGDGLIRDGDAQWENFERCQQCYAQPLQDLENQLLLYEKLRVYYRSTKDYVNNVITLGDKAPKPHSLIENTWAAQKYAINQTFSKTKQAYDNKLPELNNKLSSILDRIGQCETNFNDNPMWRQTSGLFFYNTMAISYKRSD
ncbi:hypothetical protein [Rheinheimera pleomorphica]|uniref:hypothetical protein n=1 Tax=Rheinheimera pleomorphica TaxID=2703963 RepID=UPI001422249B|nr:hypothetical protein [Rheinheimera pleomorphica]